MTHPNEYLSIYFGIINIEHGFSYEYMYSNLNGYQSTNVLCSVYATGYLNVVTQFA